MAELADAQDLGSCVYSCRFDPCYPHQQRQVGKRPPAFVDTGNRSLRIALRFGFRLRNALVESATKRQSAEIHKEICRDCGGRLCRVRPRPPAFVGAGNRSLRIALRFGFRLRNALVKSATKRQSAEIHRKICRDCGGRLCRVRPRPCKKAPRRGIPLFGLSLF